MKHKSIFLAIFLPVLLCQHWLGSGCRSEHQNRIDVDLYAATNSPDDETQNNGISIDPDQINVLSAPGGDLKGPIKKIIRNYMRLWAEKTDTGNCSITWRVSVPKSGRFEARILSEGTQDYHVYLLCNNTTIEKEVTQTGWQRIELGQIPLSAGENIITLTSPSDEFKISSLCFFCILFKIL